MKKENRKEKSKSNRETKRMKVFMQISKFM